MMSRTVHECKPLAAEQYEGGYPGQGPTAAEFMLSEMYLQGGHGLVQDVMMARNYLLRGRAVQVEPMKPVLEAPGSMLLELTEI
jgi:hypothetical protein